MSRVALLAVCGCGRFGFDPVPDASGGPGDATPRTCGASTQAPDPLTIDGATFEFISFTNNRQAVTGVTVEAFDAGGALRASTVSDVVGRYTLTIPTGGISPVLTLRYTRGGFFSSTVYLDAPLDRDIPLGDQELLGPSDGPLWNTGSMGSVYSTASTTVDSAKGTININVIDCAEQPLAGVAVSLDTVPEVTAYLGTNGMPATGATGTIAPYTFVVGFNAPATVTTVSATTTGRSFASRSYPIAAGDEVSLIRMRPLED